MEKQTKLQEKFEKALNEHVRHCKYPAVKEDIGVLTVECLNGLSHEFRKLPGSELQNQTKLQRRSMVN